MSEDYDPKLKEAMEKIKTICDEYEVGYMCVLASKTHAEFNADFPKWSLVQYNGDKSAILFKTRKLKQDLTDSSFHVFYSIRDVCGRFFMKFEQVAEELETKVDVKHNPFGGKDFF